MTKPLAVQYDVIEALGGLIHQNTCPSCDWTNGEKVIEVISEDETC